MSRSRPRVLIADDQPTLLDLFATWLEDEDIDLVRANCGDEALSYCDDGDIDVAILDRHMPRVSGDEVLDALREGASNPRVAFVTAAAPDVGIVDLDLDGYLTKPVTRDEYVGLVRSLIERERLSETAERYVSNLSKRAALLESESASVLRSDPTFAAFEEKLLRLAVRVDDRQLDDPLLSRAFADGGTIDPTG
ncbi:response regulator [Haloplanus salilacus]|uniref:response regulator transcription factor n=1 Tax=Haloplanus salilacus TaxID=2949994 RepID=UPI0030CD8EE8